MGTPVANMAGMKFGRLSALFRCPGAGGRARWMCECDCGARLSVIGQNLRKGITKSCGCLARETASRNAIARNTVHGHNTVATKSPEWNSWTAMHKRCRNPRHVSYAGYGGRGITVCARWQEFANFLADMGPRPHGRTLDRIDVNGNYEPGNCRWATLSEQQRNRRDSRRAA